MQEIWWIQKTNFNTIQWGYNKVLAAVMKILLIIILMCIILYLLTAQVISLAHAFKLNFILGG